MVRLVKLFFWIVPPIENSTSNKIIKNKIEAKEGVERPSSKGDISKISLENLTDENEKQIKIKNELEGKAKTYVIGLTISVTMILNAYTMQKNIYDKYGLEPLNWITFTFMILSVIYMLSATLIVIHVLTAENIIHIPEFKLDSDENKQKEEVDLLIGLNKARNLIRNNYIYTSYSCIRNSLICLLFVMIIAIIPIHIKTQNKATPQTHNNFYYSEKAMDSINAGIDRQTVESFINSQPAQNGEHSVIDDTNNIYIKYNITNDTINVFIVEAYTN